MPTRRHTHLLTVAFLTLTPIAHADETYIGTNTGWFFKTAWNNNAVPTSTDNVFINPTLATGSNTLTANNTISTANLTLGATAILATQIGGNTSNITILSTGQFSAGGSFQTNSILNQGTLTTNSDGFSNYSSTITLHSNSTLTNQGTISTQGGGTLTFYGNGAPLDNSNGTINAAAYNANNSSTGSIAFNNFEISGGQLTASQYNRITLSGSLSNATVNGDLQFSSGSAFQLANDTINGNITAFNGITTPASFTGSMNITGTWALSSLQIYGPVSLNGNGTLRLGLNAVAPSNFTGADANASLSIATTQTLNLSAFFGPMRFTNLGNFLGNSTVYVAPASSDGNPIFTNRGNLTATALLGANSTIGSIDNANGTISIAGAQSLPPHNGNVLAIQNMTISGGTLSTDTTAQIQFGRTISLSNLTLSGNFSLLKNANYSLTLSNVTLNGTLTANANVTSSTALTGTGTLSLAANASLSSGPLQLTAATLAGSAQIRRNTGTSLLHTLTLTSPGSLDLTTNALILTDPTASAAIQSDIATSSLFSSSALLVFIDNSQRTTPYTTFAGQPVSPTSLLIAPAQPGDATLDGTIDLNDLNTVLNNLGATTSAWTAGNFDGATTINLNDLNAVLNNLGTLYPNSSTAGQAQPLAAASAPEPASITLLAAAAPLLLRRRKLPHLSKM